MAFANDTALAARPDMFELVENPEQAKMFRLMAIFGPLIPLGFGIWAWSDDSTFMFWASLVMAVGSVFAFLNMAKNSRKWARRGGTPLQKEVINIDDDPKEARERLATKDPRQYTPMKATATRSEHQMQWIEVFWPENERVSYVVVVERNQHRVGPAPILELRNVEHDMLHAAMKAGFNKDYGEGIGGLTQY